MKPKLSRDLAFTKMNNSTNVNACRQMNINNVANIREVLIEIRTCIVQY